MIQAPENVSVKNKTAQTEPSAVLAKAASSRVTPRAFWLGLILAVALCAALPYNDYYVAATYLSGNFFPIGALAGVLLLVLAINPLLIALRRRDKLWTPAEIMTVWTMLLVVAGIPSSGLMRYLIPHIVAPHYFANSANAWESNIIAKLPARLLVNDPAAVKGFFQGLDRGESIPWSAWLGPLAWWGLFTALLFLAFFCLSALLRRQWAEHEKFSFPLVQLPVLLSETPEPGYRFNTLLRSPLLWLAVGIVTCLHTVKGLHLFVPTVPDIPVIWHTWDYLTNRPWNTINDVEFAIYPLVIGFAFLLSSEVCLSLWLFYLLFKAQVFLAGIYNWDISTTGVGFTMGPAFITYHETGGMLMMSVWLVFSMRRHLAAVWRKVIRNGDEVDDAREPLSYRFATIGLAVAYAGLFFWLVFAASIQPLMALGMLVGSFMVFIALSWLVAQAGLLFVTQTFATSQIMTVTLGTHTFDTPSLAMGSICEHVGWQDARELMLPSLLNAQQGSVLTGLDARSLTRALAAVVPIATVVAAAASIWLPYTHRGGIALKNPWMYISAPQLPLDWTTSQLHAPQPADFGVVAHMLGGALFVFALFLARTYLPSFGLHPAGFLVASSWAMYTLWFSLFLGWMIKAPVLRYGGLRLYRLLLPFFLGLILGDCLNAIAWAAIGLATGSGYLLLPD